MGLDRPRFLCLHGNICAAVNQTEPEPGRMNPAQIPCLSVRSAASYADFTKNDYVEHGRSTWRDPPRILPTSQGSEP